MARIRTRQEAHDVERHIRMVTDAIMCKLGAGQHPVRPGRARPRARAVPAAELLAFLDARPPAAGQNPVVACCTRPPPAPGRGPRPQHRRSGTWRAGTPGSSAGGGRAEVIGWETKTARCCPDTCTAWPA